MPRPKQSQARLGFTPIPSSSPAASGYNKQIQDRAAAVTLDVSPKRTKRRKLQEDHANIIQVDGANDSIPTPAASLEKRISGSGLPPHDSESDEDPIRPTQRPGSQRLTSRRKGPRQQRLDFTNGREAGTFDEPIALTSSKRPQSSVGSGIFGSQRRRATIISSDEESEEQLPAQEAMAKSTSKRARKSKKAEMKRTRATRSTQERLASESEGEDDVPVNTGQQHPIEVESEEDDDDDMPTTMGTQRRKRAAKKASPDSFISSSPPPPSAIDSDDDLQIIEAPSNKRKRVESEEEEEEEDEPVTPGRRRVKPPRTFNRQEEEDIRGDLEDLGPSSDVETSARKPRNTQNVQKEARLSALERLKRKRSNKHEELEPLSEEEEDEEGPDEGTGEDEFYEDDDDDDVVEEGVAPTSSRQFFTADAYDEEFIEQEEEEGVLGIPDSKIPIQFTRFASMKGKELFPYAVEWMVQKKLNPAFSMNDEIYGLTFKKLDDESNGLAGSKFKSSVWTQEFTFALEARPDIAWEHLDRTHGVGLMNDHCDACNRNSHPATFQMQFQGKPYHRETLEEVATGDADDSDSDSDSDNDADEDGNFDAQGRAIPPSAKIFYVGKFCMSNAQTAHALQHWRYHLNEWVVSWLERNGYLSPEAIVKRDGLSEKKRRKKANKIADVMEKTGVVKTLWRDFRNNIDDARNSKQGRWG